jgi:hypothetical protein
MSNVPSSWSGSQEHILLNDRGWKPRKNPVAGEVFFLTFPFIELTRQVELGGRMGNSPSDHFCERNLTGSDCFATPLDKSRRECSRSGFTARRPSRHDAAFFSPHLMERSLCVAAHKGMAHSLASRAQACGLPLPLSRPPRYVYYEAVRISGERPNHYGHRGARQQKDARTLQPHPYGREARRSRRHRTRAETGVFGGRCAPERAPTRRGRFRRCR